MNIYGSTTSKPHLDTTNRASQYKKKSSTFFTLSKHIPTHERKSYKRLDARKTEILICTQKVITDFNNIVTQWNKSHLDKLSQNNNMSTQVLIKDKLTLLVKTIKDTPLIYKNERLIDKIKKLTDELTKFQHITTKKILENNKSQNKVYEILLDKCCEIINLLSKDEDTLIQKDTEQQDTEQQDSSTTKKSTPKNIDLPEDIEGFTFSCVLGEGGMGCVTKETYNHQKYAIKKVIPLTRISGSTITMRIKEKWSLEKALTQESKITSSISGHKNIVTFVKSYHDPKFSLVKAMVFKYEGENTLSKILKGIKSISLLSKPSSSRTHMAYLSSNVIIDLSQQCLCGLDYIHKKNIVHLDIKPSNILITDNGIVKICDFGIAMPLQYGKFKKLNCYLGTLSFMAPEIYSKSIFDHRVDIYSLGVTLDDTLIFSKCKDSIKSVLKGIFQKMCNELTHRPFAESLLTEIQSVQK